MSEREHPNINVVGLVSDILCSVEDRYRERARHLDIDTFLQRLVPQITAFAEQVSDSLDDFVRDSQLEALARLPDDQIDTSDIPEVTDWSKAVRGKFSSPVVKREPPPVDRSQRTLTDGSPVTEDHRELRSDGMQKAYVVLSAEERAKGFVRPVRDTYRHKRCGTTTTMGRALAETYARDPGFYSGTFCYACGAHFPLDQFVWAGTEEQLGS